MQQKNPRGPQREGKWRSPTPPLALCAYCLSLSVAKPSEQPGLETKFLSSTLAPAIAGSGLSAFSKEWENHAAAVMQWFAFYDFCHVHKSLRCTPAMRAGIADHIWSVRELLVAK